MAPESLSLGSCSRAERGGPRHFKDERYPSNASQNTRGKTGIYPGRNCLVGLESGCAGIFFRRDKGKGEGVVLASPADNGGVQLAPSPVVVVSGEAAPFSTFESAWAWLPGRRPTSGPCSLRARSRGPAARRARRARS